MGELDSFLTRFEAGTNVIKKIHEAIEALSTFTMKDGRRVRIKFDKIKLMGSGSGYIMIDNLENIKFIIFKDKIMYLSDYITFDRKIVDQAIFKIIALKEIQIKTTSNIVEGEKVI